MSVSAGPTADALVNQGELARLLGVSGRQVRRWEAAGMPRHSGPNPVLYDWPTCRDWWAANVFAGTRRDPAGPDMEGERRSRSALEALLALQDLDASGLAVADYWSPAEVASAFHLSERHLRRLHGRGLPYDPERGYPLPHSLVWLRRYSAHVAAGRKVDRLPMAYAFLEHALSEAWDFGSGGGALRISTRFGDPLAPNL